MAKNSNIVLGCLKFLIFFWGEREMLGTSLRLRKKIEYTPPPSWADLCHIKYIQSVVEPVLFYCSGIWGTRKFPKVQRVLNKACQYFLRVSKNAPYNASRSDMGWVSAEVKQKIECARLWCRLKTMPGDRTAHNVHQWSFLLRR